MMPIAADSPRTSATTRVRVHPSARSEPSSRVRFADAGQHQQRRDDNGRRQRDDGQQEPEPVRQLARADHGAVDGAAPDPRTKRRRCPARSARRGSPGGSRRRPCAPGSAAETRARASCGGAVFLPTPHRRSRPAQLLDEPRHAPPGGSRGPRLPRGARRRRSTPAPRQHPGSCSRRTAASAPLAPCTTGPWSATPSR